MVRKRAENGTYYHEPSYTWEEEQALYKSMAGGNGPWTVLRGPRPAPSSPPKSQQQPKASNPSEPRAED